MDDPRIWSAYERNHGNGNTIVHRMEIANCGFLCDSAIPSIRKKCYIGLGETCAICMEPIMTKTSAWLTPCSHAFHKKCLIENYQYRKEQKMNNKYSNEVPCPVCRGGLVGCCVGLDVLDKYYSKNGLDILENFWLTIDINPYRVCLKCNHGFGMNKLCHNCEYYRNKRKITDVCVRKLI